MPIKTAVELWLWLFSGAKVVWLLRQDNLKHALIVTVVSLLIYWHWYHFKNNQDMHLGNLFEVEYKDGTNQKERRRAMTVLLVIHFLLVVIA